MDISKVVFTTDRQGHSGLTGNRSLLADSKDQRPEDGGASGRKFAATSLSLRPASRGWAASTDQLTSLCTIHILSLMLAKLQMSQKHLNLAHHSASATVYMDMDEYLLSNKLSNHTNLPKAPFSHSY